MDLVGFLYGFGVLQGVILAAILCFAPSGHRLANILMGGLVLAIALALLQSWMLRTGFFLQHPAGALTIPQLDFVWGPLLYLYAYNLTTDKLHKRQLLHFLPALVLLLATSVSFGGLALEEQRAFVRHLWSERTDPQLETQFVELAAPFWQRWVDLHLHSSVFVIQFGIYCALVLRQIKAHNQRLQQHFSSLEDMNLRWLRLLTLACLAFLLVFLLFNRGQLIMVGHFDINALGPSTPSVFLVLLIYLIGFSAIFQPDLIRGVLAAQDSRPQAFKDDVKATESSAHTGAENPPEVSNQAAETTAEQPAKYKRSSISIEDANRFKMKLMEVMEDRELYLDCELTLPDLAREAGLTPHQVSQVLNGQMNQTFFSFVNSYRIHLAKNMLSDPETSGMPIVELAVEVGFKSKSSFYDAFKKATDMTPTQFKKNQQS